MVLILVLALSGCSSPQRVTRDAQLVAIGDSILAWHGTQNASIVDVVQEATRLKARNLAVSGARLSYLGKDEAGKGYDIRAQYVPGPWQWVLFNGGANDLLSECGCKRCAATLDRMISADGQRGDIPSLLGPIAATGTRVMLLGYYDGNVRPNLFSACVDDVHQLNARLSKLARSTKGVFYVAAADVINPADQSLYFIDRVHPSRKAARLIGLHVAEAMRAAD